MRKTLDVPGETGKENPTKDKERQGNTDNPQGQEDWT